MNKNIKGITIEIEGSTTGLQKALKDVDKASAKTANELGQINRALKFDPENTTLLQQKFDVLQEAIQHTSSRFDALKQAQKEVEQQFASGKIDAKAYREFQRELEQTQGKLEALKRQASNTKAKIEVQADTSAINKVKAELKSLGPTAKQAGREIGQGLATGAAIATAAFAGIGAGMDETNQDLAMLETQVKRAGANANGYVKQVKQANAEEIANYESKLSKQETQLEKSLDNRLHAVEKSHEAQRKSLEKTLDKEHELVEDKYEKQEESREKALNQQYETAVEAYEKQLNELEKSLDQEVAAFEKAADEKIKLIDKEYTEKLKLIDEEKYNQIKAIESQIDSINAISEAEEKAQEEKENARKRAELQEKIRTAKDSKDKQDALHDLQEFEERLRLQKAKEQRKAQIDNLRAEKESIDETFSQKKDALKEEFDERKQRVKDSIDVEKEILLARQKAEKESFIKTNQEKLDLLKDSHDNELESLRKLNQNKLKALKDEHDQRKSMLDERLNTEMHSIQNSHQAELTSFREMNKQKLELAKKPITVEIPQQTTKLGVELNMKDIEQARVNFASVGQDVDQVTESMGNLIQAGYTTEKSITAISESIAGAIVSYGDTFNAEGLAESITTTTQLGEATGQLTDLLEKSGVNVDDFNAKMQSLNSVQERANYISELLANEGLRATYEEYVKANPEIVASAEAQQRLTETASELSKVLAPLVIAIKNVVASIMEWLAENPELARGLAIVAAAITAIAGIVAVLGPVISGAIQIFGGLGKILPHIGKAFTGLLGPVGLIILTLTTVLPLVIKHWDSIKAFFVAIWNGIVDIFKGAIDGIVNFIKTWGPAILIALTGPFGLIINFIKNNWELIKSSTTIILNAIKDVISKIVGAIVGKFKSDFEGLKKAVAVIWNAIKTIASTVFEGLKTVIMSPVNFIRDNFLNVFNGLKTKLEAIWNGIVKVIKKPINMIIEMVNKLIGGLNKIETPDWLPIIGGKSLDIPEIPMLAKGTNYFRGGMAIVGEQGPELVTMPTGAKVHPNDKTKEMLGGDIIITGNHFVIREEADIKKIARELENLRQGKNRAGGRG